MPNATQHNSLHPSQSSYAHERAEAALHIASQTATDDPSQFTPSSDLYGLLMQIVPQPVGFCDERNVFKYCASKKDLEHLANYADGTLTTFALGMRAIGSLITNCGKGVPPDALYQIGELLTALGEGQLVMADIAHSMRNALPASDKQLSKTKPALGEVRAY